ncbi:MAG: glycosyltransferase [Candidatus Sericytochromatia bacterium]|nr:glycosyltransferase [Candidatus Sericytochromatia bacterium]
MRILTGPVSPDERDVFDLLADADDADTRLFADDGRPFAEVLAELPKGWVPDAVVVWNPEYRLLPPGLADCPYPLVLLCTDWNVRLSGVVACLPMADQIFIDRRGVAALQGWGLTRVDYWPLYAVDPAKVRHQPDQPIRYDISFIGNFNHAIHEERSHWLARLARLSNRYRVAVLTGVYGEAYGDVLSQSRIVFNHSVRGEMNVRAYEAAAAGRLLMMEAGNAEVRDYLEDGVSCVLYDAESFDAQVAALLADPETCDRIGQAGHVRLSGETYDGHWARLQTQLAAMSWPPPADRAWHRLSRVAQLCALALQALYALTPGAQDWAQRYLDDAATLDADHPRVLHGLACLAGFRLFGTAPHSEARQRAGEVANAAFATLLTAHPGYALAWMNAATVRVALGDRKGACEAWQAATEAAQAGTDMPLADFIITPAYDRWRIGWERCAGANDVAAARQLILTTACKGLGLAMLTLDLPTAQNLLSHATRLDGTDGEIWAALGDARSALGDMGLAIEAWQRSLALQPFAFAVRESLITAWLTQGSIHLAVDLLDETDPLLRACPAYDNWQGTFAALRERLTARTAAARPIAIAAPASDTPPKRLLVASCVRQKPTVLPHFLRGLAGLEIPAGWQRDWLFVANGNEPAAQNLLNLWATQHQATVWDRDNQEPYGVAGDRHQWSMTQIDRVAAYKDEILRHAVTEGYDAVFLADSDLVLHPATLLWLQASGQPIVSEIFWTAWDPADPPLPNVWVQDHYAMALRDEQGETPAWRQASNGFLRQLKQPGVYPVGGLGACTWIDRAPLVSGVRFQVLPNVSLKGEDRHFCIRAMAHDFPLFVDTHVPAFHLYRESDLAGVQEARLAWDLALRPASVAP